MEVEDRRVIKSITAKYSELGNDLCVTQIRKIYRNLLKTEEMLDKYRQKVTDLETERAHYQELMRKASALYDIEYGKREIHEIKEQVGIAVINPSDYRNNH